MCKNTLFRTCFVKPLITFYFLTWKNTSTFLQPTLHCLFFLSNKTQVWFLTSTFVKSAGSCDSGVQVWIKIFTYCERAFMTKSVSSKMPRDFFLSCVSIVFVTSELEQSVHPTANREAKMKVPFPLKLLTNTSSGCGSTRFAVRLPRKRAGSSNRLVRERPVTIVMVFGVGSLLVGPAWEASKDASWSDGRGSSTGSSECGGPAVLHQGPNSSP